MYLCTQRSTHVASPTLSSGSLYMATRFLKHCSVILRHGGGRWCSAATARSSRCAARGGGAAARCLARGAAGRREGSLVEHVGHRLQLVLLRRLHRARGPSRATRAPHPRLRVIPGHVSPRFRPTLAIRWAVATSHLSASGRVGEVQSLLPVRGFCTLRRVPLRARAPLPAPISPARCLHPARALHAQFQDVLRWAASWL